MQRCRREHPEGVLEEERYAEAVGLVLTLGVSSRAGREEPVSLETVDAATARTFWHHAPRHAVRVTLESEGPRSLSGTGPLDELLLGHLVIFVTRPAPTVRPPSSFDRM